MTSPNERSIADLLAALCDETISSEEMQLLDGLICTDAEARRLYREYLDLHARLSYQFHQSSESSVPFPPTNSEKTLIDAPPLAPIVVDSLAGFRAPLLSPISPVGSFALSYGLAAVIVGVGLLVGWVCQVSNNDLIARRSPMPSAPSRPESAISFVGRVTGMMECKWADKTDTVLFAHVPLGRKYSLTSGLLEITYDSGARIILQGPCIYFVDKPQGGFLKLGRVTARVENKSPSRRNRAAKEKEGVFAVRTPTAVVTDLGTEFGVEVDDHGATESHVFQGSILLTALDDGKESSEKVTLVASESARVDQAPRGKAASVRRAKVDPASFVRSEQFASRAKQASEAPLKAFRHWQTESEKLRKRPGLLVYYDFQRDADHPRDAGGYELLRNRAATGSTFDGCVRGAMRIGMSQGRFPGKDALKFMYAGDGVRINVPNELDQFTMAASLSQDRCDGLAGIMMSDQWFERAGCVHWQFCGGGLIKIATSAPGFVESLQSPQASDFGGWHIWSVVYDGPARRVRAYIDGRRLAEWEAASPNRLRIGEATVGNWFGGATNVSRALCGRMDEFALFDRALTDAEIKQLFGENVTSETGNRRPPASASAASQRR